MAENTDGTQGQQQSTQTPAPTETPVGEEPLIESASATTSSSRNKSGYAAFVIAGIALAVMCLLASTVAGCTSSLIVAAIGNNDYYGSSINGNGYGYGNGYGNSSGGSGSSGSSSSSSSTYTTSDVLDDLGSLDIADDGISQSMSYSTIPSDVPSDVSTFVSSIVSVDDTYTEQLVAHLKAAATASDSSSASKELSSAQEIAKKAQAELDAIGTPSGDASSYVASDAADAKRYAIQRWSDIATELDMTVTPGTNRKSDLVDQDDVVGGDTSYAALYLDFVIQDSSSAATSSDYGSGSDSSTSTASVQA